MFKVYNGATVAGNMVVKNFWANASSTFMSVCAVFNTSNYMSLWANGVQMVSVGVDVDHDLIPVEL